MPTLKPRRRIRDEAASLGGLPPEGIREPFKPLELAWSDRFPAGTGGMDTQRSPDQLQPDQATLLQNYIPRESGIIPAFGYEAVATDAATQPRWVGQVSGSGGALVKSVLVRVGADYIEYYNEATDAWVALTVNTGTAYDAVNATTTPSPMAHAASEAVFFTNSGVDGPWHWDITSATYDEITDVNAPLGVRSAIGFADRVIAVEGVNAERVRLRWCVSGDVTDWTSTGSGSTVLDDSGSVLPYDPIKQLLTYKNVLVILRAGSIWLARRTGIVANPFQFSLDVPGLGTPFTQASAACGQSGIIFPAYDNVYLYKPQSNQVLPIGTPIRQELIEWLQYNGSSGDPAGARTYGIYDIKNNYYWLFASAGTNATATAYIFDVGRWEREQKLVWFRYDAPDYATAAGVARIVHSGSAGSDDSMEPPHVVFGSIFGETFVIKDDRFVGYTPAETHDGTAIESVFISPQFTIGHDKVQLRKLGLTYTAEDATTLKVSFSVDGAATWTTETDYALAATDGSTELELWVPNTVSVYGSSFMVRFRTTSRTDYRLIGYRLGIIPRGHVRGP